MAFQARLSRREGEGPDRDHICQGERTNMSLAWIDTHREEYLRDGAKGHLWDSTVVGGPGPVPTLLLFSTGRKSGKTSIMPLIYGEAEGGYVIVASKGGAPANPDWYFNIAANPEVEVQVENHKFSATAETVHGDRRAAMWDLMVGIWPDYANYQEKTEREIPVVLLSRKI
jgi:deazaflavin-dependent oxidoreductase (nitroreductase family)